ncbi:hypothetical protein E1295_19510 [Nonomuraea mesophila]|uniref:Chitinase n=1 Tax=Nonomuraea mesophila TaxID=2530382 RepID=A0A4R5FHQ6_9ACTN|nr:hypothetical protein [Nonomuraea mesophila]TDE50216.1 hypothetical protein E1295_19510 [Nonomuraea mesophila]
MPRHTREPGLLPRPLAILAALALVAGTGAAIRVLPAGGSPPPQPSPPVARPSPSPSLSPVVSEEPPTTFVAFVDTAREPGFDLPASSRRTGVRRYALGHLVADAGPSGDGCVPAWTGSPAPGKPIGRLRALGGDAALVFGGPGGRALATTCTRPGGLATAYRRIIGAYDATTVDFEVRDSADRAAVLRRARAIHAVQQERDLRVSFTLALRPGGLSPADVAMLRTTRRAGADVGTVNLLAPLEGRTAHRGRLGKVATAVRAARVQIARAQGVDDPGEAWERIALTPVLAGGSDLGASDARTLAAYATRHRLAWVSLRGAEPSHGVSRILLRALS